MRALFFVVLMLPAMAYAQESGLGAFFSGANQFFSDISDFFMHDTPSMIQRAFAYLLEWGAYLKFYVQYESMKFAWGVAKLILEDLAFGTQLQQLLTPLPQDVKATLASFRVMDAIEILITAHVTRYVMDLV